MCQGRRDRAGVRVLRQWSQVAIVAVLACAISASTVRALPPLSVPLQPVVTTASTGEKPQSKVWRHGGFWWSVLPNSSGTWLRRLDGATWTDQLLLSSATNTTADVKSVGDVAHILLFRGTTSELASVEYVGGSNTYQFWSSRPGLSTVTLDAGVETATIDVDSQGRMWLASDASTTILVRYSDPPYGTWSAPLTLATGVSTDDISAVTALPNGTVGILWSNQNTRRFGFRVHADGSDPTAWSGDEVPASASALNVGLGMADDHLNFAVAADATLYAAVKTSYDTAGFVKIALLVRRPAGTWDSLYSVDEAGTRAIALLDEGSATITVVYTSTEGSGDIVYRESPLASIAFGPRATLIAGSLNDVTSTKQNITDDIVLLARTTSGSAAGVRLSRIATATPTPTDTTTSTPTWTATATQTSTLLPTTTASPTNTVTPTNTSTPTPTPSNTPTETPTNTSTQTPTVTASATRTAPSTETATATASPSASSTATATTTATITSSPTTSPTRTAEPTSTATATASPTPTPASICPPAPMSCRTPVSAQKGLLQLRDSGDDAGDRVRWKWLAGAATVTSEFGGPLNGEAYALCIYDGASNLVRALGIAGGGMCRTRPCWRQTGSGFKYSNRDLGSDGVSSLRLKAGGDGKARIVLRGMGGKLAMPDLAQLGSSVTVQLRRSGGGPCWGAVYSAPFARSDATEFKDKAD